MLLMKEHYDLMEQFEKQYKLKPIDREKDKAIWAKGHIYENGHINDLFAAYRLKYCYFHLLHLLRLMKKYV